MMRYKRIVTSIVVISALLLCCIYSLYNSKYGLSVSYYTFSSGKIEVPIRIVHLSDLHDSVFGINNGDLVSTVNDLNPDAIFITGDLVNDKKETDMSVTTNLIEELAGLTDVYFSLGNQEIDYEQKGIDIRKIITESGAVVLDYEWKDTEIKGNDVRIGGIYGYCQTEAYAQETKRYSDIEYLKRFQDNNRLKMLLCHMPVCWIDSGSLYDWDVDYIFSGHAHGGQIRLPFIGGLWAPDQGWFPGKECGIYTTNEEEWKKHNEKMIIWATEQGYETHYYENRKYYESTLILSRGLGSSEKVPRINNIPEIVVVDYVPKD